MSIRPVRAPLSGLIWRMRLALCALCVSNNGALFERLYAYSRHDGRSGRTETWRTNKIEADSKGAPFPAMAILQIVA